MKFPLEKFRHFTLFLSISSWTLWKYFVKSLLSSEFLWLYLWQYFVKSLFSRHFCGSISIGSNGNQKSGIYLDLKLLKASQIHYKSSYSTNIHQITFIVFFSLSFRGDLRSRFFCTFSLSELDSSTQFDFASIFKLLRCFAN